MKKELMISVIVFIFVSILIIFYFFNGNYKLTQDVSQVKVDLMKQWGENCNIQIESATYENPETAFSYPGVRAFLYGGDPQCDHVYREAFDKNNSEICNYLTNTKAKAICVGSSSQDIVDFSLCNEFENESKEICLMNILLKDYKLNNISSEDDALSICSQVNSQPLKSICLSYIVEIFENTNLCNFEGELKTICIEKHVKKEASIHLSNEQLLKIVGICDSFFEDDINRISCYYSTTYNFHLFGNQTSFGNIETERMTFSDYSDSLNKKLIILTVEKKVEDSFGISSIIQSRYSCQSIFDDLSLISSECVELKGNYCYIGFSSQAIGCENNLPHWRYNRYS